MREDGTRLFDNGAGAIGRTGLRSAAVIWCAARRHALCAAFTALTCKRRQDQQQGYRLLFSAFGCDVSRTADVVTARIQVLASCWLTSSSQQQLSTVMRFYALSLAHACACRTEDGALAPRYPAAANGLVVRGLRSAASSLAAHLNGMGTRTRRHLAMSLRRFP